MNRSSHNYDATTASQQRPQTEQIAGTHHHSRAAIYFVVAVAALGGLLFGYDTAVISGALLFLRESFALTPITEGITVSAVLLGATFGALAGGKMSDAIGRRKTLIVTAIIFIAGAFLTALAPNLLVFIVLRSFVGVSIGATACVVPVYISEMAPSRLRGTLVTFNQLAITIGIAISYWVDLAFANAHMGWAPMYAVTAIPGSILLVGMLFNAETPRWLASKGRWSEAQQTLELIIGIEAPQELETIRASFMHSPKGAIRELLRPGLRSALIVGVGLAIFQQLVGINTVIYYAPTIFRYAGFASVNSAILATTLIGIVNVLATIVASVLVDKVGRRLLLLAGTGSMVITLAALGTIFAIGPKLAGYFTLAALLIYIVSFALSMGPVFWLMSAEIFPTRLRATGSSIASFANWSANLLVSITFLSLINLVGKAFTFWLYALLGVVAFVFCLTRVPETRKKSLEQIESYWQNGRQWDSDAPQTIPAEAPAALNTNNQRPL